jgi:hypothetical protein
MGVTDKAKDLADIALEKLGEYSEKATELAGKAGVKAAELTETAREKAPAYIDRATEFAGKAVGATAAGVDKATQGRYSDKIGSVSGKVGATLDRARAGGGAKAADEPEAPPFAGGSGIPTPQAGPEPTVAPDPKAVPDEE